MPLALLPDIYKTSALPRADPKLRLGDQSILLLCQVLQSMAELSMSEDRVTPNWRYGDLSQMAHYVLQGLKHYTEVTNTIVSTFFPSDLLIGHVEGVLRATIKTCEEVEKESMAGDSMRNGGSDIDISPAIPVTPWSMCLSNTEDFFDFIWMDVDSGLDTESGLDITA